MLSIRRIPPYLLAAIAGILISGSIASVLQNISDPVGVDVSVHNAEHGLISESLAVKYPLEVADLYKLVRTEGDTDYGDVYLRYHEDVINSERSCEFCTLVEYTPGPIGQSEISFTSSTGYDLSGAKKVTLFIMGADGDESVTIKVAGKEKIKNESSTDTAERGKKIKEFAATTKPIKLDKQWKKLEIDLTDNADLKRITDAFAVLVKASDNNGPVAFYIKQVTYESSTAKNPVPVDDSPLQEQGAPGG